MKLIANQITNLTDARYFAARGCHALIFDLDSGVIDPQQIPAIVEWIAGPEVYLHTDRPETISPDLASIAHGIWTDATGWSLPIRRFRTWSPDVESAGEEQIWIVKQQDWPAFVSSGSDADDAVLWLDTPDAKWFDLVITRRIWAMMIDGSEEEITGFKSFDSYDDFIDRWEELSTEE